MVLVMVFSLKLRIVQPDKIINETAFNILQATRTRVSKTEYISCPSCGALLFDLQETTSKIRSRTSHLKGIKNRKSWAVLSMALVKWPMQITVT